MEQQKKPLYQALMEHKKKGPISFHVPGHKYGQIGDFGLDSSFESILTIDVTELTGLDDLHSPEEAILEAELLLANLYQVKNSFFLVNGSTVGNIAMIMAVCSEDDVVLVQRNCHKSVLNALQLAKARPIFLEPEYHPDWKVAGGVQPETVAKAIEQYPMAKAIILTYPNYYGMVYDLKEIIDQAHLQNIPVLVDEAHGAHFILGNPFPASAIQLGADIVVQSAHKTLPAMTMGSYLHFNSDLINLNKVKEYLGIFQSSSPSYPIMASLDLARSYLARYGSNDLCYLHERTNHFKEQLAEIPTIKVLEYPNNQGDLLKITIQSKSEMNGFELQKRLEGLGIYTELADPYNILLILPLLKEGQPYPFTETADKLKQILQHFTYQDKVGKLYMEQTEKVSGLAIGYKEMDHLFVKDVPFIQAHHHVCAETIIPYPPGIPLLLKGERITSEKLERLQHLIMTGARFQGGSHLKEGYITIFQT
ncbi:aminotransferase class I/II-fold pyridoxal phosphate-dependent enzyme [Bacillus sp. JJ1764]|uniref:aminotransferase class I/II-fold pyridoxal phosphate-dependent enzyme n=1 Tax=Bacillus sp. JJ1764 TaxID=3122964 RepID=UPI002FFF9D6A